MTSVPNPTQPSPRPAAGADVTVHPNGAIAKALSWVITSDHRRIARMNFAIILIVAIVCGLSAVLANGQMGHSVGAHRFILAFWALVPLLPATLGVYFLPQMIGAQRFAFPRMNTLTLYLFAFSAAASVMTLVSSPVDTDWAIDTLSSAVGTGASIGLIVAMLAGIVALLLLNLNMVVTTQTCRANGVGWLDLPAFVWGLNSAALVGLVTLPLGFLALLLLLIDRELQTGLFDPALGGVPGLYQHMFWFAAHPALYNALLPAVGIIAVVVRISPRNAPASHQRIALCILAIAALNGVTWGVELITSIPPIFAVVFSSLAMLIVIPALIIAGALLAALRNNNDGRLTPPFLYTLAFLFFAGNGVAAGLLLRPLSTGMQLFNTPFNTAHLNILLIGGVGSAFFAGLLHWWPRITGRRCNALWTAVAATLFFEGVTIAIFPQFVIGLNGVPPHIADATPMYDQLQRISAMGSWLLVLGVAIQLVVLGLSSLLAPHQPSEHSIQTFARPTDPAEESL